MNTKIDYLNKLAELSLRMANVIDRRAENGDDSFPSEVGYGYLALSGYLRNGVKAIADIQNAYSNAVEMRKLAEQSERDARAFLVEIFGDEEVDSLKDEYKEKIKNFVAGIFFSDGKEE